MDYYAVCLALAIVLEVSGTTCMKLSEGFTRPWAAVGMVLFYIASFSCLTISLKRIDLGVAYAIWAGVGTALVAVIGFTYFREQVTTLKVASIALVVAGVVGLNLGGGH